MTTIMLNRLPQLQTTLFRPHLDLVDEALWGPLSPNHQDACVLVKLHPTPGTAEPIACPGRHRTHAYKNRHTHVRMYDHVCRQVGMYVCMHRSCENM